MTTYYEAHITMIGDPVVIRPFVEAIGWKFSAIDGDPVMGEGVKYYATMLWNRKIGHDMAVKLLRGCASALEDSGCVVLRRKVEEVIFDDRSEKVQCLGMCPECMT